MDGTQTQRQLPFPTCYRVEYAREWGPCVLGIDQAVRGSLSASIAPLVLCGIIVPCVHEPTLQSLGLRSNVSGGEQERFAKLVHSDSYISWLLRTVPSEAADGMRCSMGILEHTTASYIIKEALATGIDVRSVHISCYSDPDRFRQFLFEAFPMIENISVYPRVALPSTAGSMTSSSLSVCDSMSPNRSSCLSSIPVPAIVCAAGIVAQSARDELSRQLLFRQRHYPTPLAPSPLSRSISGLHRHDRLGAVASASSSSLLGEPMYRSRASLDEDESERASIRCSPFVGNEFGESHCGLVSSSLPQRSIVRSEHEPISMYDFYDDDDDESEMIGLTSPKRIRVVPCSPTLTVFTCEDSLPCSSSDQSRMHNVKKTCSSAEHSCSPPYVSSSLFVSPPFASSCSSASTSVPMFSRSMLGMANPF